MKMMLRMSKLTHFDANCTQKEVTDILTQSIKPSRPSEPSVIYVGKQNDKNDKNQNAEENTSNYH